MKTSALGPDSSTASRPSTDTWSLRCVTADPRKVVLKVLPSVRSGRRGALPADPFHHALPAALTRFLDSGSLAMFWERYSWPRKYASAPTMIASSLTPPPLNNTCSVFGLTTTRSIVQRLMGTVGRRAPEAATTPPLDAPANFSVYEPVISKLLAKVSPSAAPFSNARVVGCPRLKGKSHAESAARTAAPATAANARCPACESERDVVTALGSVTGCIL